MNRYHRHKLTPPFRCACNILVPHLLLLLVLFIPSGLLAGEYHSYRNGTLYCDECHTTSPPENGDPGGSDRWRPAGADTGSFPHMLKREGNRVCTHCHDDNMDVSDVVGVNRGSNPQFIREAGALNVIGGDYPYREEYGHTLGLAAPAPGSRPTWIPTDGLMCIDCHDPHGDNPNGNAYRNLTAFPGNTLNPGVVVTYSVWFNDASRDVFIRSNSDYDVTSVDFNEPVPNYSAMADFCRGCHNEFHGLKGGSEVGGMMGTGWVRHPSSDADIGAVGGRHSSRQVFAGELTEKDNYLKVMTNSGNWTPRSGQEVTDHSPTCVTCHKAHGNMNPFGLIFMGDTGPMTEEGTSDGRYTDLCRQCHVQSITTGYLTRRSFGSTPPRR